MYARSLATGSCSCLLARHNPLQQLGKPRLLLLLPPVATIIVLVDLGPVWPGV